MHLKERECKSSKKPNTNEQLEYRQQGPEPQGHTPVLQSIKKMLVI